MDKITILKQKKRSRLKNLLQIIIYLHTYLLVFIFHLQKMISLNYSWNHFYKFDILLIALVTI